MATERELRAALGGRFWSTKELKAVLGVKDARTVKRQLGLDTLQGKVFGRTVKYWGADIARRIGGLEDAL